MHVTVALNVRPQDWCFGPHWELCSIPLLTTLSGGKTHRNVLQGSMMEGDEGREGMRF